MIKDHSGPSADRPSMEELQLSEMYHVVWAERDEPVKEPPPRRKRAQFDARRDEPVASKSNLASHQLIVVTHTGDWFRLGVPDGKVDEGDVGESAGRADRCEVLEYRRLGTVAAEW